MSVHSTLAPPSTISSIIICTSFCSTPFTLIIVVLLCDVEIPPKGVRERGGVERPLGFVFRIGELPGI